MAANRAKPTRANGSARATFRLFDLRLEVEQASGLPAARLDALGIGSLAWLAGGLSGAVGGRS